MARRTSLAVAAAGFAVFVALLVAVSAGAFGHGSVDARADVRAHATVVDHHGLLTSARWLTNLGAPYVVDAVAAVAAVALWLAGRRRAALYVVGVRVIALVVESSVKLLVARSRPALAHPVAHATGYSFPSGHATGAASLYLPLALVACTVLPGRVARAIVISVAVLICLVVATTRVLLGVHYPSDVIAGLAIGVCATAALLAVADIRLRQAPMANRLP